jgi:hypothetical protein
LRGLSRALKEVGGRHLRLQTALLSGREGRTPGGRERLARTASGSACCRIPAAKSAPYRRRRHRLRRALGGRLVFAGGTLSLAQPPVLLPAFRDPARKARRGSATVLGGKSGRFLLASGSSYGGPYFGNHVRFFFRERGVSYVATLHSFGNRETTALLGRLIAQLRQVAALRAPTAPRRAPAVRLGKVGPRAIAATPHALWILTREQPIDPTAPTPYARGALLRLDPASGRIQGRVRVAGYMRGLATAAGSVWVATARPLSA